MGKLLMLKVEDDKRLEKLQKLLKTKSKVQVLRDALSLLEERVQKAARIERWKKAVQLVGASSDDINKEFRKHSRLKRHE